MNDSRINCDKCGWEHFGGSARTQRLLAESHAAVHLSKGDELARKVWGLPS